MKMPGVFIYRIVALIASARAGFTGMAIIGQRWGGFVGWDGSWVQNVGKEIEVKSCQLTGKGVVQQRHMLTLRRQRELRLQKIGLDRNHWPAGCDMVHHNVMSD